MFVRKWLLMVGLDFCRKGNFVTLKEMGQSYQCAWKLCWKLMKLRWNKRGRFSVSLTTICNFWHRANYTSSVDGNLVKQTVHTTQ